MKVVKARIGHVCPRVMVGREQCLSSRGARRFHRDQKTVCWGGGRGEAGLWGRKDLVTAGK